MYSCCSIVLQMCKAITMTKLKEIENYDKSQSVLIKINIFIGRTIQFCGC